MSILCQQVQNTVRLQDLEGSNFSARLVRQNNDRGQG